MEKNKIVKHSNFENSDDYRQRIHQLIPGGAHTYSKGDDTFPKVAPAAIRNGKGAHVWDIDGNKYLDCAMGLTSVTLGHAFEPIDEKVIEEIKNGLNFQRPSHLEGKLAKEFLSLIPAHDRIKFAKNGSTVTTAAVKLARAYTKRKLIAFPSDQPFFSYDDWFIGKTPCSIGVPEEISSLSITFESCSIESLKALFMRYPNQIAAVIFEPKRMKCDIGCNCSITNQDFLKKAADLIHENGSIFIVDEMITGFKAAFPGLTSKLNIDSDITTWGKSSSNGYSFAAMTGKAEIMDIGGIKNLGKEKFFMTSTTHGAETIGLRAVLETLNFYKKNNVIAYNHSVGEKLYHQCMLVVNQKNFSNHIKITPNYWMLGFELIHEDASLNPHLQTAFSQEMILRGVLIQATFVPCFSHQEQDIETFINAFSETIESLKELLMDSDRLQKVRPTKRVFRKYI